MDNRENVDSNIDSNVDIMEDNGEYQSDDGMAEESPDDENPEVEPDEDSVEEASLDIVPEPEPGPEDSMEYGSSNTTEYEAELESMELSRSPQLNAVVKEAEKVLDGVGDKSALKDRVRELDMMVTQMAQIFKAESRYEERTESFVKDAKAAEKAFEDLKYYTKRIRKYFDIPENRYIEEGVGGCLEGFEHLFAALDRMKDREMRRKVYSRSPYLNEVMRVADCVTRGTLPPETLKERLMTLIRIQENFYRNFDQIKPGQDERYVFEENQEAMKKNMKDLLNGLYEVKDYFKDNDKKHIERGLEKAGKAAETLMDIDDKMRIARETPKIKSCFKCGADNPRTARYCVKCNFSFPQLTIADESAVDIRLEEGGVSQTGHIMSENVMKLASAVEDIKQDKINMDKYRSTLDWFADIADKTRKESAKVKEPEKWDNQEAKEAYETFKQTFFNGLAEVEKGLSHLRMYINDQSPNLLETGLEMVMAGADQLYQVQMVSNQIKQAMEEAAKQ